VSGPLLAPPSAAPDFAWRAGGTELALSAACREQGALVLFLPLAWAPVCGVDVRSIAAAAAELGAPRRPLVFVSVDRGEHLRRFLDEAGAGACGHLGDPTLALAERYGARRPEGFAARASFLVGRDGRIAASALHPFAFPRPLTLLREWAARA
jgi:peroxiredoxin